METLLQEERTVASVSARLRSDMSAAGLTQAELETLSGVQTNTISRLLNEGVIRLSDPRLIRSLRRIARALGKPHDHYLPHMAFRPENQTLSAFIRTKRVQLGLTQAQLADLAGVGRGTVSRLESDDTYRPSLPLIESLFDALSSDTELLKDYTR